MNSDNSNYYDDMISQPQIKALDGMSEYNGLTLDDLAHDLIGKAVLDLSKGDANELFDYFHGKHDFSPCNLRIDELVE